MELYKLQLYQNKSALHSYVENLENNIGYYWLKKTRLTIFTLI